MADSRVQGKAERWLCDTWAPEHFPAGFSKQKLRLSSGGRFEFDAVSDDLKTAMVISTSRCNTVSGNKAWGKINKIRSDLFFLLLANVDRRIAVFSELSMFKFWQKQKRGGRVPASIIFKHAVLPSGVNRKLVAARAKASHEQLAQHR